MEEKINLDVDLKVKIHREEIQSLERQPCEVWKINMKMAINSSLSTVEDMRYSHLRKIKMSR